MEKKSLSILAVLIIMCSCIFSGCKKEGKEQTKNDTTQQEYTEKTATTENEVTNETNAVDTEDDL